MTEEIEEVTRAKKEVSSLGSKMSIREADGDEEDDDGISGGINAEEFTLYVSCFSSLSVCQRNICVCNYTLTID